MPKPRLILAFVPLALVGAVVGVALAGPKTSGPAGPIFDRVKTLVSQSYVDAIPEDTLSLHAAQGLVAGLKDPYSVVMNPRELTQLSRSIGAAYGGLGIQVEATDEATGKEFQAAARVVRVFANSPASQVGLVTGDLIARVNGQSTSTWDLDKVIDAITGPVNTSVKISIARPGLDSLMNLTIVRRTITAPTIPFTTVLHDSIGYLPLVAFGEGTTEEVLEAISSLRNKGAKKLILDLRSNPGGRLEESIYMAELFLPKNAPIASVESRRAEDEKYIVRQSGQINLPLTVLVNGSTASASEILTGALQDNDRALVVGQPTFGKGLVQSIFPLQDGYALKLTTGRWKTPSGRSIQRPRPQGLTSDQLDSLEKVYTDTLHRPIFKTPAGRSIKGGGGVVPDLLIYNDTTTLAERAALGKTPAEYTRLRNWLINFASRQPRSKNLAGQSSLPPGVLASAKAGLLKSALIKNESDTALNRILPRLLGGYIAEHSGSDLGLFYFEIPYDHQLQAALKRLEPATSTSALLNLTPKR